MMDRCECCEYEFDGEGEIMNCELCGSAVCMDCIDACEECGVEICLNCVGDEYDRYLCAGCFDEIRNK